MNWKDELKKEKDIANERFPDSDRDWMERDAETAFDEDRHKRREINELVDAITREIDERLDMATDQVHITY